jgi:hypothetical protein
MPSLPILFIVLAICFSGCAREPAIMHTTENYDIVVPRQDRAKLGFKKVAINLGRRVIIRDSQGHVWRARAGEWFKSSDGYCWQYRLKSVNPETGELVLIGERRIYFSGSSRDPIAIAQ